MMTVVYDTGLKQELTLTVITLVFGDEDRGERADEIDDAPDIEIDEEPDGG